MRSKRQREKEEKKAQERQAEIKQRQEIKTMQKRTEQIITSLDEKNRRALMQIGRIIERLGIDFAEQKLAEAEIVEEQGGLMIAELKRRRTKGGVFFFLVKKALREAERKEDLREIFYRNQFDWLKESKEQKPEETGGGEQPGGTQKPPRSPQLPPPETTQTVRKPTEIRKSQPAPQESPRKSQPASPSPPPAARKTGAIQKPAPSGTARLDSTRSTPERKKPGSRSESANVQEPR